MPSAIPDLFFDFEHFTLDQLERIVPVSVTRSLNGIQFTLLSLECYRAGFAAIVAVEQERVMPDPPPTPETWVPPLLYRSSLVIADAFDDNGGHYVARHRAGTGGGVGPDRIGLRFVYCLAPGLDPSAQTLSFSITQEGGLRYDADGQPQRTDADVLGGPWTISFTLPTAAEEIS